MTLTVSILSGVAVAAVLSMTAYGPAMACDCTNCSAEHCQAGPKAGPIQGAPLASSGQWINEQAKKKGLSASQPSAAKAKSPAKRTR
jgi:hypothetical protein